MSVRTSRKTATFAHPFSLSGVDEGQSAGTDLPVLARRRASRRGFRRLMRSMRRHCTVPDLSLILWAFLMTASGIALAQGGSADIPENAHAKSYGGGWECGYGYRVVDEACGAIKVPENGYLADSAYGSDWQCDRGYRKVDEACVAIKVPENGYLADSAYGPVGSVIADIGPSMRLA
jgi:hypothetical protein